MGVSVVLSYDFNEKDWSQITSGFNLSFHLNKQPSELPEYYKSNELGYSFHAICRNDNNEIIAHSSIVPYYYCVSNERFLFGLSGGTFVLAEYRKDAFLYLDLLDELKSFCHSNGVALTFGVSNKNSFGMAVKLLGSVYLKDLIYYTIPVSLTKVVLKKKFIFVDNIFEYTLKFWVSFIRLCLAFFDSKEANMVVKVDLSDKFYRTRFRLNYRTARIDDVSGVYRIVNEGGLNAAYIMDFRRKGRRSSFSLATVVRYILKNEKIDIILFVGELNFLQPVLLRVPKGREPQKLPLTYDLLDKDNTKLTKYISDPGNWDFSLMNFDAR